MPARRSDTLGTRRLILRALVLIYALGAGAFAIEAALDGGWLHIVLTSLSALLAMGAWLSCRLLPDATNAHIGG